jgi:hypothetical protein
MQTEENANLKRRMRRSLLRKLTKTRRYRRTLQIRATILHLADDGQGLYKISKALRTQRSAVRRILSGAKSISDAVPSASLITPEINEAAEAESSAYQCWNLIPRETLDAIIEKINAGALSSSGAVRPPDDDESWFEFEW